MTYRVLTLTVALGISLSSAALAKPQQCPVGECYVRSKNTCIAKKVAIDRGIYHNRHQVAAKVAGTTVLHRQARARAAARAAVIPLPPVRLVGDGTASAPARHEVVESVGSVQRAPENERRSISPYGALVPVAPTE
jgi:hypothetical protein